MKNPLISLLFTHSTDKEKLNQISKMDTNSNTSTCENEKNLIEKSDNEKNQSDMSGNILNLMNMNENVIDENMKVNQLDTLKINDQQSNDVATNSNDQLNFELKWMIRNNLIFLLNEFSSFLYGENILNKKQEMINKTNNLIIDLFDLPLKLDKNYDINLVSNGPTRPILILESTIKNDITDLLAKNKNYSILYKDIIDIEEKIKLIKLNNNLISKLMNLPIQLVKCSNEASIESNSTDILKDHSNSNQLITKNDFENDLNNRLVKFEEKINSEIQILKNQSNEQLNFSKVFKEMANDFKLICLNSSNNNNNLNSIDNSLSIKEEVNFFYELKDFDNFSLKDNVKRSQIFKCLNFDWTLKISKCLDDNKKHVIGFWLAYFHKISLDPKKRFKVDSELNLLNQLPNKNNKTFKIENYIYNENRSRLYGTINCSDLINDGFAENDQLSIHLILKAEWIDLSDISNHKNS